MAAITRSPNYPVTSIEQAIERVKMVYKAARFGKAAEGFLATSMGYKGLSGASRSMLATLKKYGLIETESEGFKLSELAKTIVMLDANDPRYAEAVRKSALMPPLFAELYETYGDELPDDNSLRFLLVGKKFLPDVAKDVVRIYRETLEFLQRMAPPAPIGEQPERPETSGGVRSGAFEGLHAQHPEVGNTNRNPQNTDSTKTLQVPVEGCIAYVRFEGQVTKEVVKKLVRYLDLFSEDQPSTEELRSTQGAKQDGSQDRSGRSGDSQEEPDL